MNPKVKEWIHVLQEQSSEPLCAYIYDLEGLQKHVQGIIKALPVSTSLFYAIKANPDPKMIQALLPLVRGFEVASIGELNKVREVSESVPILFGGPGKKDDELEMAIRKKVTYLHIESLLELKKVIRLAKREQQPTQVLLRMNLRTNTLPHTKITMGGALVHLEWMNI